MKRFIDLGHQIYNGDEGLRCFTFYCTVNFSFETFSGSQVWKSIEEFKEDYTGDDIDRYLNLIPKDWNNSWKDIIVTVSGKEIKKITSVNYVELKCLADLESDLIEAIRNENFELAASIRDKIKK